MPKGLRAALAVGVMLWMSPGAAASNTFLWKVPATATVVEAVEKNGQKATLQYRFSVKKGKAKPSDKAPHLLIGHSDFKFLELPGVDLDDPKVRVRITKIQKQASAAIPVILAEPQSGRFVGVLGVEEALKRLQGLGSLSKEEMSALKKMLNDRRVRATVEDEARHMWLCWAGAWRELALPLSQPIVRVDKLDVFGKKIPVDVRIQQQKQAGSTVQLVFEGGVSKRNAAPMLKAYNDWMKVLGAPEDKTVAAVTVRYSCRATVDLKTRMPRRVERRDEVKIHYREALKREPQTVTNAHRYEFKWDAKK